MQSLSVVSELEAAGEGQVRRRAMGKRSVGHRLRVPSHPDTASRQRDLGFLEKTNARAPLLGTTPYPHRHRPAEKAAGPFWFLLKNWKGASRWLLGLRGCEGTGECGCPFLRFSRKQKLGCVAVDPAEAGSTVWREDTSASSRSSSRQRHAPAVPPRTPSRAVAVWTHLGDHGGDRRGVRSLLRNHRAESIPYHLDQLADDGDGSWIALGEPGQVSEKLGAFRGCGDDRGVAAALFCHGSVLSRARFQTSWSTLSWSSPRGWHRREWSAPGLSGWTALVSRFRAFHAYLVALRR